MQNTILISLLLLLSACTINIMQTDTHGTASDVVDSTSKSDADIQTDLSLPVKGI